MKTNLLATRQPVPLYSRIREDSTLRWNLPPSILQLSCNRLGETDFFLFDSTPSYISALKSSYSGNIFHRGILSAKRFPEMKRRWILRCDRASKVQLVSQLADGRIGDETRREGECLAEIGSATC